VYPTTAALDDHVDDEDEHVEDAYTNVASNENTTKYKIPVTELHAYIEKKQINVVCILTSMSCACSSDNT
jgi:hypothetical protein